MSNIKQVLEKHLSNPSPIQGVLDDLVYSMVLGALIGEMKEVIIEERQGLTKYEIDSEERKLGESEITKLRALIIDLEIVKISATGDVKDVIRRRYMK